MKSTIKCSSLFLLIFFYEFAIGQSKMVLMLNNKQSMIYGYTMGDPSSGNSKIIDLFGAMENANVPLTLSQQSGNPISEMDIIITDPASNSTQTIKLSGVMVRQIKNYTSNYSNGMFELSSSGALNMEAICDFQKSELIYKNDGNTGNKIKETPALKDNTLEKLETKPNSSLKGSTGRVYLDLPADVECVIFIYNAGTNKEITGTTRDRQFYLAPGKYDVDVSSVKMEEIEVQKGMDTRIKAGILNVSSPPAWALYDETKKIRITGASKSQKIGLPVGNYQLQMSGSFQPVTIKDGETVNF